MSSEQRGVVSASVMMITYNDEAYIRDAIDSILVQSFRDFELLVVDDGSTDNTRSIILSYSDSRIRLISHEKNMGRPYARNTALNSAKGKYLFWMDADDISMPKRLEKQIVFMERHPNVSVCSGSVQCFHQFDMLFDLPQEHNMIAAGLFFWPTIHNQAACFRGDAIMNSGAQYDPAFPRAQDYDFWCQLVLDHRLMAANLPELLVLYRARKIIDEENHKKVHKTILDRLGIQPTEKNIQIYFQLTFGEKDNEKIIFQLKTYKQFSDQIISLNRKKQIFPHHYLNRLIYGKLAKLIIQKTPNDKDKLLLCIKYLGMPSFVSIVIKRSVYKFLTEFYVLVKKWATGK